jgi:hypothetical protein
MNRNLRALLKVDYICPVIDEDYFAFAAKFGKHKVPKMLDFTYGDLEGIRSLSGQSIDGDNILVGNSATPAGNHVDMFLLLRRLGVKNLVVAPLSYGDVGYGKIVSQNGREVFGERFRSIDAFMPLSEYLSELRQAAFVVMGHRRQQAMGNVLMALWLGAKVFFVKGSPVYDFLKKRGGRVFLIEDASSADFFLRLAAEEIAENRMLVERVYGREVVARKTEKLIEALCANDS